MNTRDSTLLAFSRRAEGKRPGKHVVQAACAASVAAALAAPLALAQNAAGDAPRGAETATLSTVVVTAERRAATVQSVPLSVTAYSADALAAAGITDLSQIGAQTPGVSERNAGPGQTEYEMRGIAASGGQSPTVGFYLDDTPLTAPAAAVLGKVTVDPSLYDLDRVEILRGPQGTLYGAGSMGGTIKLITKQPDFGGLAASGQTTLAGMDGGGFNRAANVMLNVPVVKDMAALRVVATDSFTDGWISRDVISDFPLETNGGSTRGDVLQAPVSKRYQRVNWERLRGARATLAIKPSTPLSITAGVFYQRIEQGGANYADNPPGASYATHYQPFDVPEPYSDSFILSSLVVKYAFDSFDVISSTASYRRATHMAQDAAEPTQNFFEQVVGIPDVPYSDVGPFVAFADDWSKQTSEELRLASSGDAAFQWQLGGFFQDFKSLTHFHTNTPGQIVGNVFGTAAFYDVGVSTGYKQYAGFGEASYRLPSHLKLTAGLRYFSYNTSYNLSQAGAILNGSDTPDLFNVPAADSGVNPKVNLSYQPNGALTVYVQAAKGFRPGLGNTPAPDICQQSVPKQYKPDSLWSYELGEKAQLFDQRLTINSAAYFERWTAIQQQVSLPCGFAFTENAGTARVYGGEVELEWRLNKNWSVTSATGYTNATVTGSAPGTTFYAGEKVQEVPAWTNTTSLAYQHPVGADYQFAARATGEYVGSMTDITYQLNPVPARSSVSLRAGVDSAWGLTATLFVNNLTDRRDVLSNTNLLSLNVPILNRQAITQPRTIGLDLMYEFDRRAR